MKNRDQPANPTRDSHRKGLTKFEYAAIHIFAQLQTVESHDGSMGAEKCLDDADFAVLAADLLFMELDKTHES